MTSDAEDGSRSPSPDPDESGGEHESGDMAEHPEHGDGRAENGQKPASNVKDPLRPRRKKARRACFACQRAHLTCGRQGSNAALIPIDIMLSDQK